LLAAANPSDRVCISQVVAYQTSRVC